MARRRKIEFRLRALELSGQALDLDFKRARVYLKQYLPLPHSRPFRELHAVDEPADSRMYLDGIDGLELAGEFVRMMQRPRAHFGDRDGRRRRCSNGRLRPRMAASGQYEGKKSR